MAVGAGEMAAEIGTCAPTRWLVALLGGFLAGFGARWAGGYQRTRHQRNAPTRRQQLIAAIGFFVGGIATTMFIYYVILN